MPADQVVLDLETKKAFDEVIGRNLVELGVSVVGVYFYETEVYRTFEEHQFQELEQSLSQTTRVIGFNIRRFDFPVLQPLMKRLHLAALPYFDLLEDLEKILGHRVSLQSIATATLNEGKSGSGLDAIHYYRSGEWDKLKKYCLDDVRLTREIYEFGRKFGYIYYQSKGGSTRLRAEVQWKDPEKPSNLSLF